MLSIVLTHRCMVFFFKQKTAYEMRISDWSSDVCSADLHDSARVGYALRQCFDFAAFLEGMQAITHPLHHGARHKYTALQRVQGLATGLCRAGGDQAVL